MISMEDVRTEANRLIAALEPGEKLDELTAALVGLAVNASASTLDKAGIDSFTRKALAAGGTPAQIHETLLLVSGLGVHTLLEGSRLVAAVLREQGNEEIAAPLDPRRQALWARFVGDDPYWDTMEREIPGFLDALVRLSPEAFEAFFVFCAVPWRSRALSALSKELISVAVDATPSHRYLPGMRLHLSNAIERGAGKAAILQTLDIAASAPLHSGVR